MKARTNARPAAKHPKDVALLVIDVQQGLFAKSIPIYHADELLKNIGTLVDRAHRTGATALYA
jgi:nicotinamidase-related amidase